MTVAAERLVNLALFLSAAHATVTADQVRHHVYGYPKDQDEAAFLRMFERDKDELRRMGFAIDSDESGAYRLDVRDTFASAVDLTPSETAAVRVAGAALLADPSYPFAEDLRLALAKVSAATAGTAPPVAARLADEDPQRQGEAVALLSDASASCKRVTFDYTNSTGGSAIHEVEPYGLFLHDGRWYLVARDVAKDEARTYAVSRMEALGVNASKPRTPDFERPADFDVAAFARLPFQYGPAGSEFRATLRFEPAAAWRAASLSAGHGTLETRPDGGVDWAVPARSVTRLLRFVVENGPGISLASPPELAGALASGLGRAAELHG